MVKPYTEKATTNVYFSFGKHTTYYLLMFVCGSFVPLENCSLNGDVTIAGERLQILTEARHLWPLSSESVLATPTVTLDNRSYWSSPRTHDTHIHCPTTSNGDVINCFYDIGLSQLGFEQPTFRLRGELFNP